VPAEVVVNPDLNPNLNIILISYITVHSAKLLKWEHTHDNYLCFIHNLNDRNYKIFPSRILTKSSKPKSVPTISLSFFIMM